MAKFIKINTGGSFEEEETANVGGVSAANKVPNLDAEGKLALTMMPSGIGADTDEIMASEALAAGDFVNIWDDGGTAKLRKATADALGKRAHGYVLVGVALGETALVYYEGPNNQLTGLTPGATYFLDSVNPGKVVTSTGLSTTSGHIVQEVGVAVSATKINVEISKPIVRA